MGRQRIGMFVNRVLREIFGSNSEKLTKVVEPCHMRNFMFLNKHFSGDKIDADEMGMEFNYLSERIILHTGLIGNAEV
jgi:hypothetical protein